MLATWHDDTIHQHHHHRRYSPGRQPSTDTGRPLHPGAHRGAAGEQLCSYGHLEPPGRPEHPPSQSLRLGLPGLRAKYTN